jgi:hypothetical protein
MARRKRSYSFEVKQLLGGFDEDMRNAGTNVGALFAQAVRLSHHRGTETNNYGEFRKLLNHFRNHVQPPQLAAPPQGDMWDMRDVKDIIDGESYPVAASGKSPDEHTTPPH